MSYYKKKTWILKRVRIFKRDDYLCRECKRYGKTTAATTVHHINPLEQYPELALVSVNLISFCTCCHDKMHDRTSGILTALGEQWRERMRRGELDVRARES